ncbi:Fe-S protein assembly chaperone HscA [Telmatospirillum sp.]|uniref:Fe-S protein assembly chaperone HscA n=1 Tax=Telmatospirillum sp. TaxID=2079197 RepID=UPI00283D729D|nr:Fe-S protein assembly chaperone HscA [Telmatospirillum sp.]MDR3439004.1 Fe-S protein assembly chaperone HscA [Telmatospirillum sp.]
MLLQINEPGATPAPHANDQGAAVGIDLGTTNSVVAIATDGQATVLRDEAGHGLIPSVVAYGADGTILVGREARRELLDNPETVVSSIKRLMGRGVADVKSLAGTLPFELDVAADGGMVRLKVSGRTLTPVEVSADILRAVKARAEAVLGKTVDRAVVTVPAYFDDGARSATKDAARLAGLAVLRLVNEPTAAALAYGLDNQSEGLYAVYDLGGGTFDISILRMEKGVFQVRATGGDAALGGDDFDHAIAESFLAERAVTFGDVAITSSEAKQALATGRMAKECLSSSTWGEWVIELDGKTSRHRLELAAFEAMAAPFVERTIAICRAVLVDAGVGIEDIKGVVLVGGSTRVPLVRRRVAEFFGREPLANINPDEVVAVGAALQAEALTAGSDTLLLDVTPLSLGIETMGGIVEKVIPRNTPIPVAMAQEFTTYQDGQDAMLIHVVQGEREMVDQCRSLARFVLSGIPAMAAGAARIRVTFAVDADGLLTVSAKETTTEVEQAVSVKPSYGLTDDEMATMLRDSLEHAEEDMTARLLVEAKVEAERSALAVKAALAVDADLLSTAEQAVINRALDDVERTVKDGDRDAVLAAAAALETGTKVFAERRMDRGIRQALAGMTVENLGKSLGDGTK